jgi:pRiA4b ORF-3-like protein
VFEQQDSESGPHSDSGRAIFHVFFLEFALKPVEIGRMTTSSIEAIATLRIEIKCIEPMIWRRVAVRTSMNLLALHKVIQATMGWLDYHLWEFVVDDRKYGIPDPDRPHVKNGATTQLATILATGMSEFGYVYDFGDNWEHRIIVEQIGKTETGAKYPRFLGGERRCPPEDCGGPPGYFDFIESITRKNSKKAKEVLDWYGGPFEPNDIDEEKLPLTGSQTPTE